MNALDSAGIVLLPLLYLVTVVLYGRVFAASAQTESEVAAAGGAGAAGWALRLVLCAHLAWLVAIAIRWRQLPAANVAQALSVLALAVAVVYAFVEWHGRDRSTGPWLVGTAFVFQLLSSLLARPGVPPELPAALDSPGLLRDPFFALHVSLALLAYAAFAVAAAYGFLFLVLYRELKTSRFAVFFGRLPPLASLDRMLAGALMLGFAALTGAVVVGIAWAQRIFPTGGPTAWLDDPKLLATMAIWLLYGATLLLRRLRHWQARQTAIASLTGLGAILFSLVAVNSFLSEFHAFR